VASVSTQREKIRQKRLKWLALGLMIPASWMWSRLLDGKSMFPAIDLGDDVAVWAPGIILILLLGAVLVLPMLANGRSPHIIIQPEQIDIGFDDVRGLGKVLGEVKHTLAVLKDHDLYRNQMGGRPRRGVLFEGPPGTGKTHMAKAMAKEANVPFLFISATSFQSMFYGMTARRIRAFFKALRKTARLEGGVIGFIEEIDAIGLARGGVAGFSASNLDQSLDVNAINQGSGGVVNELLVQMQSFDNPSGNEKFRAYFRRKVNYFLAPEQQLKGAAPEYTNLLLIAATNRASSLDKALLRPGRFDRILHFPHPGHSGRRELIDLFLERKAHTSDLDEPNAREDIASATLGYTPASLERLFDEALLLALREDRHKLCPEDVTQARFEMELGLPEEVESPEHELETIATHEAGHAVIAYLVGKGRRLEVLSIVKRGDALGFLAHRMTEERHTQKQSELRAMIQISLGGLVAEEVFFSESGSGPAGDLISATNVAAEMVGSMGLGGSLISYRAADTGAFGGNVVAQLLADPSCRAAIDDILDKQKVKVTQLMTEHRYLVEALRDALLDRRELIDTDILEVLHEAETNRLAALGDAVFE
jgi:cell division protease FtsH